MFNTDTSQRIVANPPPSKASSSKSAFKLLLQNFLAVGADPLKLDKRYKKAMRCQVREIAPQFLLTDGQYTLNSCISREAFKNFSKDAKNTVKVTELKDYMITIDQWELELAQVTSEESFSSYAGLEMRLIINKFSQHSQTRVSLNNRYPQNLYRDDEACFCISKFLADNQ